LGLGGFVDGIVLHQILQWHHMLTDYGDYDRFPPGTVADLEDNSLWDGLFHAGTWVLTVVGLLILIGAARRGRSLTVRELVGLLLMGWGLFNLVKGPSTITWSHSTTSGTTSPIRCGGISASLSSAPRSSPRASCCGAVDGASRTRQAATVSPGDPRGVDV
jgi:hypothetical protein